MKRRHLKKLNRAKTCAAVEEAIGHAGYAPFEEGTITGLTLMTIFKARERHTRKRKKADGVYIKLQSFTSPEGAEDCDFIVIDAAKKRDGRGEDGKKFEPLYYKIFYKKFE